MKVPALHSLDITLRSTPAIDIVTAEDGCLRM